METMSPPRPCTCGHETTCRKAREREAAYPGAQEKPGREEPRPDRAETSRRDLDWLDPLDESDLDALRLAWAFMQ